MVKSFDVIIVGAGPAGVCASISCRNNGLNVLLLDKKQKKEIGDKVCGEALSKETALLISEKLGIAPPKPSEINTNVKELILKTALPDEHIIFPAIGYMIDRHKFGQKLLNEAENRKIELYANTKVREPIIEDRKVSGVVIKKNNKSTEEIKAKLVIDCSGISAVIRTALPDNFASLLYKKLEKKDFASCYREIIELEEEHNYNGKIVLQYEEDIPEPGYIWFFGDGGKRLNCGAGFIKIGKNKDKSVKKVYSKALGKYFKKGTYKVIDGRGGNVPVQPPLWNAVAPGLIVAGDAAFHADPLTAEGHGPAMIAGWLAGEVAKEAITHNRYDVNFLWKYNKRIIKRFGIEHTRNRVLALALERLGAKNLEFLLKRKVIQQSDLTSEGVSKEESILSLTKRAIRCFPKLHLLLTLKKAIDASKTVTQLCKNFPKTPEFFETWKAEVEKVIKRVK
ncbi:MAG: NAD(P)/FAD-dependent oxidoreductase [Candidatus Heimdallarchaeaceae archaeon]